MSIPYSRYLIGSLPWYSVLILTGVIIALCLCSHEEKRRQLPPDTVIDLAFWVIPLALIGARLYYVAFQWSQFADDLLSILRIWEGGLAIYGGVLGGLVGVLLFAKRRRMNPLQLTDMIVPGLALAQSIGRWGNYFNMEAYGREITAAAWQFFPVGVQIPGQNGFAWHMATFFYESCWDLLIFLLLWFVIRRRNPAPGRTTLWYMLLYGLGRAVIEGLRMDSLMSGSIRISQLLSISLVLISACTLVFLHIRRKRS